MIAPGFMRQLGDKALHCKGMGNVIHRAEPANTDMPRRGARFLPDGGIERGLAVMQITASGLKQVDPAPTGFTPAPAF